MEPLGTLCFICIVYLVSYEIISCFLLVKICFNFMSQISFLSSFLSFEASINDFQNAFFYFKET